MQISEFIKSLRDHHNPIIFLSFRDAVMSDTVDIEKFLSLVASSYDLDKETRTRILALFLLLKGQYNKEKYSEDFVKLFDMSSYDTPTIMKELNSIEDDEIESQLELESDSKLNRRTIDTSIFQQSFSFLSEFSEQVKSIEAHNAFVAFNNLMIELIDTSITLRKFEIYAILGDENGYIQINKELNIYCKRLENLIEICESAKANRFQRQSILGFFNSAPNKLIEEFSELFDDGIRNKISFKQELLRKIANLFYLEYLDFYPSSVPNTAPSGVVFIDEQLKNDISGIRALDLLFENSINKPVTKEIAQAVSNLGLVTPETLTLLDYTELPIPFVCPQTVQKYTSDQRQLVALAINAFNKSLVGMFAECFKVLDYQSKSELLSYVSKAIKDKIELDNDRLSMMLIILTDREISQILQGEIYDEFFSNLIEQLNLESDLKTSLALKICEQILKLYPNQQAKLESFFQNTYEELRKYLRISNLDPVFEQDYQRQMSAIFKALFSNKSSILRKLNIKFYLDDFIRLTTLNISKYFTKLDLKAADENYLNYILGLLINKLSELDSKDLVAELSRFKDNLKYILKDKNLEQILKISESFLGGIHDKYQKYCGYLLFLLVIGDELHQINEKNRDFSEDLSRFLQNSYASILAKQGLLCVLKIVSNLPSSDFVDFSQMTFESIVQTNSQTLPDARLRFCLRASTLLSNKEKRLENENIALITNCNYLSHNFKMLTSEYKSQWILNFNISSLSNNPEELTRLLNSFFVSATDREAQSMNLGNLLIDLALLSKRSDCRGVIVQGLHESKATKFFQSSCDNAKHSLEQYSYYNKSLSVEDRAYVREFIIEFLPKIDVIRAPKRRKITDNLCTARKALNFDSMPISEGDSFKSFNNQNGVSK